MTMPGYQTQARPAPRQRRGMAVAALVLGLVGLPGLLACGIGMLLALVGLVLGILAAVRGDARGVAVAGVVASAVTLLVGIAAAIWMLNQAAECADQRKYPDDAATRHCIEREFPFAQPNG